MPDIMNFTLLGTFVFVYHWALSGMHLSYLAIIWRFQDLLLRCVSWVEGRAQSTLDTLLNASWIINASNPAGENRHYPSPLVWPSAVVLSSALGSLLICVHRIPERRGLSVWAPLCPPECCPVNSVHAGLPDSQLHPDFPRFSFLVLQSGNSLKKKKLG